MGSNLPILYSFRRCPYAMRARMALAVAGLRHEIREISLKDKPAEMLLVSPKATVPVLVLPQGEVIEESRDIMLYALKQNDPERWLQDWGPDLEALVERNDGSFKTYLDQYKYPQRFDVPMETARDRGLEILMDLENRLAASPFLASQSPTLVDICLFPFVRQFAAVDPHWFQQVPLYRLRSWLAFFVEGRLFAQIMTKHAIWKSGQLAIILDASVLHSPMD
ncbi:glutathione S-transferase [Aquidulcibacter sp.]|jgi:glutathione S-transferase|uniref:glutathione S-transferase n=1 Tax=Aquidulcibacter sp. TaxID=2052990 RepID=UPI0037C07CD8